MVADATGPMVADAESHHLCWGHRRIL